MADAVQTQETGGGEGSAPAPVPPQETKPAPPQESKPADPAKPAEQNEAKKEAETAAAPEQIKTEEVKASSENSAAVAPVTSTVAPPVSEPVPVVTAESSASADPVNPASVAANPTSAVPVDAAPVAAAPITAEPVSTAPISAAPVSEAPVSAAPVAAAPIAAAPVAEPSPAAPAAATSSATTDQNANNVQQKTPTTDANWQQRELELLNKIGELEKVKNEMSEDGLKLELKVREEEIDLLKARVRNLETELHAALSKPNGKNHEMIENIKQQHEELLSKARGMIFDKTKMVKNQELQIEALTTQVQSLKDINQITKDLLEIRNSEVKAMEDRLQAMEARFKAEKERYGLVLQRAQTSNTLNDDLKKEYETQLNIFKELRVKYDLRVQALVAENEKLKASIGAGSGPSAQ